MFKTGIQGEGDYITGVVVKQLCDWLLNNAAVAYFEQLLGARSTQTLVEIHKMQPFSVVFRQLKLELIDNCTSSIVTCFLYRDNLVIKDQKYIFLENKFLVANVCCIFILAHF